MSTFKVEYTKISNIIPIPGADKVELAQVNGMTFQFVVGKGQFKINDPCIYFPIDSILPQTLIDHFGIAKFLSGAQHNRIKTNKFLKQISQGYVASVESVLQYINMYPEIRDKVFSGQDNYIENIDYTSILGIEKYEAPITMEKGAKLIPLSGKIEQYDIEGSQRYPGVISYMMDKLVSISEKIEGMNGGASVFNDGKLTVNQRNFFIEPIDEVEHTFWTLAKKYRLHEIGKELIDSRFKDKSITFRFETIGSGIQGNLYKLTGHDIRLFDIKVEDKYRNVEEFLEICSNYKLPTVPILAKNVTLREWLNGKTFEEAANGKSVLYDGLREGIVCKCMEEIEIPDYGRSIIKNRSVLYLAKTDF